MFLDYAHAVTRLEELRDYLEEMNTAVPDAAEAAELDNLARSVLKLISILPDVLYDPSDVRHQAAVSEMTAHLTTRLDRVRPLAIVRNSFFAPCVASNSSLQPCSAPVPYSQYHTERWPADTQHSYLRVRTIPENC